MTRFANFNYIHLFTFLTQVKSTLNVPSVESFDRLCHFSYSIQHKISFLSITIHSYVKILIWNEEQIYQMRRWGTCTKWFKCIMYVFSEAKVVGSCAKFRGDKFFNSIFSTLNWKKLLQYWIRLALAFTTDKLSPCDHGFSSNHIIPIII